MVDFTDDSKLRVAAVCGNEVRFYGEFEPNRRVRTFLWKERFPNYAAALWRAIEFEDTERGRNRRQPRKL